MAGISVITFYTCIPYIVETSRSCLTVGVKTQALRLYALPTLSSLFTFHSLHFLHSSLI
jgi:hypothetical protein